MRGYKPPITHPVMQISRIRTPSQCHRREPSGIIAFTYDASGNLKTFTQPLAATSTAPASTQTGYLTTYNANGAFLAGTSTTGQAVTHTYTPRGKPATQTIAGQTTTYLYDAIGQDKKVTYPNGDRLDYTYSPAHQLTRITWNGTEIYPTSVVPLNPLTTSNNATSKITQYAANVAQMLGISDNGAGISPFGKNGVGTTNAAKGGVAVNASVAVPAPAPSPTFPNSGVGGRGLPGLAGAAVVLHSLGCTLVPPNSKIKPLLSCPTKESCKEDCVKEYEQNHMFCEINKIIYGNQEYVLCKERAAQIMVKCMKDCDGK